MPMLFLYGPQCNSGSGLYPPPTLFVPKAIIMEPLYPINPETFKPKWPKATRRGIGPNTEPISPMSFIKPEKPYMPCITLETTLLALIKDMQAKLHEVAEQAWRL